jgi:hypothetical protein
VLCTQRSISNFFLSSLVISNSYRMEVNMFALSIIALSIGSLVLIGIAFAVINETGIGEE